jgi:hypothetical protein
MSAVTLVADCTPSQNRLWNEKSIDDGFDDVANTFILIVGEDMQREPNEWDGYPTSRTAVLHNYAVGRQPNHDNTDTQ